VAVGVAGDVDVMGALEAVDEPPGEQPTTDMTTAITIPPVTTLADRGSRSMSPQACSAAAGRATGGWSDDLAQALGDQTIDCQ